MKNLKNFFVKYSVGIFFLLLLAIFAYPYIFLDKTPFPSDYMINHFPPWSNIQEYWGPVKNGAMPDIVDQIYPWRHFSIDGLELGEVQYWNPYNFSGNPHLANFQSAVFSPFNFLFLFLPFIDAWSILIVAQPLIAGFSMYLLLGSFKKSKEASVLAGTSFMFCGFIVVWMAYGTLAMAISFLPLSLYAAKKYVDTSQVRYGFLLSLTLVLSFFSGHFQTSLYLFIYLISFIVFLLLGNPTRKKVLMLLAFTFLGVLVSLFQLFPTIQFYLLSVRSDSFISGGGVPFGHLVTLFAPDFFGNPVTRNDWVGYYAEWAMFVGIIPLFFGVCSFLKLTREVKFGIVMSIITFLLAVSSPVQSILGSLHIPVLSTSSPSRVVVLLSFTIAFLSAFGFDTFCNFLKQEKAKKILQPLIIVGIIISLVWLYLLSKPYGPANTLLAQKNLILSTVIFGVLFILSLVTWKMVRKKYVLLIFSIIVILLSSFDSLRFAMKWMPVAEKDKVFIDLPVVKAMQNEVGHGRVFGNLGAQVTTYYQIPGIEGYDPLYIGRYGEFVQAARTGEYEKPLRSVVKINRDAKYIDRLIDLLGVSVVYHPIADTNQSWAYPVWNDLERFKEIYKDSNFQLFRNNTAIPRGTVFYKHEVVSGDQEVIERFYSDEFDYRNILLLEKDPGLEESDLSGEGVVSVIKDDPQNIVFKVKSNKEGLLFLSDNFYTGWHAKVNGSEAEIYRANYSFRAVKIPKGESEVEFYYEFEI